MWEPLRRLLVCLHKSMRCTTKRTAPQVSLLFDPHRLDLTSICTKLPLCLKLYCSLFHMCVLWNAQWVRLSELQILCIFLHLLSLTSSSNDELRLYKDLMTNYNSLERPVSNSSVPLAVKMRLFLQQIVDVDEKNQVVQINAWLRYASLHIAKIYSKIIKQKAL